ncbi:c-type cytochrome [Ramlibacter albus]|uniref:Cytochrome c n=1 Tax=Ramlibacter albus TaxID=2079448 RepID=A0A923S0N7_9BURK|nr:cytochrome c [Ramlibacter albus]MBC5763445.1 cytochrome c [Ramlibacter albus]
MKKFAVSLAVATLVAGVAGTALAQSFQKPEDAIKYRRSAMTVLATHFGALGAMANGRAPYDAAAAARHADVISVVHTLPFAGFGPGTDKGETRAKPEVWSEAAKFKQGQDRLHDEITKLAAAAKTGSLDNLKAAWSPNSGSCKACHDTFRKD